MAKSTETVVNKNIATLLANKNVTLHNLQWRTNGQVIAKGSFNRGKKLKAKLFKLNINTAADVIAILNAPTPAETRAANAAQARKNRIAAAKLRKAEAKKRTAERKRASAAKKKAAAAAKRAKAAAQKANKKKSVVKVSRKPTAARKSPIRRPAMPAPLM